MTKRQLDILLDIFAIALIAVVILLVVKTCTSVPTPHFDPTATATQRAATEERTEPTETATQRAGTATQRPAFTATLKPTLTSVPTFTATLEPTATATQVPPTPKPEKEDPSCVHYVTSIEDLKKLDPRDGCKIILRLP